MTPPGPVLRDIHMPPPASWWPLAPGWWGVLVLLLALASWLAWRWWRRRLPRRRWREARRELEALQADHHDDPAAFAAGVSQLLRRVARLRDPSAAGLRGEPWQAAMREMAGGRVATQPLEGLERAMYQPHVALDVSAVAAAAHQWLHRVLLHGGRRA